MFLAGGRGHFGGTENILKSNYLNMWLLLSNALLCPKRWVDCLGQNLNFGRKKACCSTSEWYEFQFRSQSSWYISICTIFLVYRYLCIQNMISKITLACMHCWRPWWSAAWPRPPTKSRYLLSGALHLTTSSIYQRESPMSLPDVKIHFCLNSWQLILVWVPESVLHVNGVFSSRSTSASYRQASYTHLLFVIFDTTSKLYNPKKAWTKKYCQDCGCCPGPFSDCYVTFINLHDLSFSSSPIFLALVNIVDHQFGKRNLIFKIIDKHRQRHNGPKGWLLSLKLQFLKSSQINHYENAIWNVQKISELKYLRVLEDLFNSSPKF